MSHASGLVKFGDGEIWHYEYNGTADICISHIYPTFEEMDANWRKSEWMKCNCGGSEPVEVYSSYGWGFMLEGEACRKCKSLDVSVYDGPTGEAVKQWVKDYYANRP